MTTGDAVSIQPSLLVFRGRSSSDSKETKNQLRILTGDKELSKTSSSVKVLQEVVSCDWLPSILDFDCKSEVTRIKYRPSVKLLSICNPLYGPGSNPGLFMGDLWWTKSRWGSFSPSTSVSPANSHSTDCSTITVIYHLGLVQ
jgi:hypothetical protein